VPLGLLALPLLAGLAAAAARPAGPPSLILPGDRAVRAGQLIELRWAPADSVSELEILLSVDGGRHYRVCISPELDPRRLSYAWRVPELAGRPLRLRIRFNRGGREIEGPPSAPLRIAARGDGEPEPLGLPPLEDAPASRTPRPGGDRAGAPLNGPASRTAEASAASGPLRGARGIQPGPDLGPRLGPGAVHDLGRAARAPRFVPLRA
jgi:hypothetical protein